MFEFVEICDLRFEGRKLMERRLIILETFRRIKRDKYNRIFMFLAFPLESLLLLLLFLFFFAHRIA